MTKTDYILHVYSQVLAVQLNNLLLASQLLVALFLKLMYLHTKLNMQ